MHVIYSLMLMLLPWASLFSAVPLETTQLGEVEWTSWYLIGAGFIAELFIMYILLAPRESFIKICGITLFMNVVSVFMSTVAAFGAETMSKLLMIPDPFRFGLTYVASVAMQIFSEVLIVQKLVPHVDRAKLIAWLSLANIVSVGAAMYGVWITRV